MTEASTELILQRLDQFKDVISDQNTRLAAIEKAISIIAVQETEIMHINEQISTIWRKYDNAFDPDGAISKSQDQIKKDLTVSLSRQWVAIGVIVAIIGALKLWG
jgi:hypothetical protein